MSAATVYLRDEHLSPSRLGFGLRLTRTVKLSGQGTKIT